MEAQLATLDDFYQGIVAIKEAHILMKKGAISVNEFKQLKRSMMFKLVYRTPAQESFEDDEESEEEKLNKELARKNL